MNVQHTVKSLWEVSCVSTAGQHSHTAQVHALCLPQQLTQYPPA